MLYINVAWNPVTSMNWLFVAVNSLAILKKPEFWGGSIAMLPELSGLTCVPRKKGCILCKYIIVKSKRDHHMCYTSVGTKAPTSDSCKCNTTTSSTKRPICVPKCGAGKPHGWWALVIQQLMQLWSVCDPATKACNVYLALHFLYPSPANH